MTTGPRTPPPPLTPEPDPLADYIHRDMVQARFDQLQAHLDHRVAQMRQLERKIQIVMALWIVLIGGLAVAMLLRILGLEP